MQNKYEFSSIGIVGLGLIGGSLAKSFKKLDIDIYGLDRDIETLKSASLTDVFEGLTDDINAFLSFPLDLIYICLPINASLDFMKILGTHNIKTPITDACSTKTSILELAIHYNLNFCGGHPIRGKETSGFLNSESDLFKNACHIITPITTPAHNLKLAERIKKLHTSIDMHVVEMTATLHDETMALISHFPHIGAFCLIDMVKTYNPAAFQFIGGGFRDFTRIAASDPIMWADIFLDNKENTLSTIDKFKATIDKWRDLIADSKYEDLKANILSVSNLRRKL